MSIKDRRRYNGKNKIVVNRQKNNLKLKIKNYQSKTWMAQSGQTSDLEHRFPLY